MLPVAEAHQAFSLFRAELSERMIWEHQLFLAAHQMREHSIIWVKESLKAVHNRFVSQEDQVAMERAAVSMRTSRAAAASSSQSCCFVIFAVCCFVIFTVDSQQAGADGNRRY